MKRLLKALLWLAAVAALLLAAVHVTLAVALNTEKVRGAVTGWLERSTGWKVAYGKLAGGLFPPRLEIREAKGEDGTGEWNVAVGKVAVGVDVWKKEVSAVRVERPEVRHRAQEKAAAPGGGGGGGTGGGGGAGAAPAKGLPPLPKSDFGLKRLEVSEGRYEEAGADGAVKFAVDGISFVAEDVALAKPLQAELGFRLGSAANAGKVEFNAGAPAEWWARPGDWPVRLRAEVLVEDIAAAGRALGGADTGKLQRPGLWANFVGTPASGISLSGALTDGQRFQSPDITVNWKGSVKVGDPLDAKAMLAGLDAEVEIAVPVFRWGALAVKNGKGNVDAAWGEEGPEAKATAEIAEIETAAGEESLAGRVMEALRGTAAAKWLPGLAGDAAGTERGTLQWGRVETAAHWKGKTATVESLKAESAAFSVSARGTADTGAKTLDFRAELAASLEETARLAGGKSLEGWMPVRDGCLTFPVTVTGPWEKPRVVPDGDIWETHVREQLAKPETQAKIEREVERGMDKLQLHSKDRKNIETGLKLLEGFLK